jgi:hypothetical protein
MKAQLKISNLLIALVLISACVPIFSLFMANLNTNYPSNNYDNESLEFYNKLDSLTEDVEETKESADNLVNSDPGALDIIGGFLSSSLSVIKNLFTSYDLVVGNDGIIRNAAKDLNLGQGGNILVNALGAIVGILIFVGFVLYFVTGRST